MSYTLIWANDTARKLRELRQRDGDAVKPFHDAINSLVRDPRPSSSVQMGGTNSYRLRTGKYRALYEISDSRVSVTVLMIGTTRSGDPRRITAPPPWTDTQLPDGMDFSSPSGS
ncbi:type II toxin-antitoxin system RelE/ParE family toxin [Streptomyces sp. NPDC020667]|uniref:type II toxin-antitoxin system RelE family toxin n=1 Tax=Streptomyces sp. NPDC020667 TaxID=3154895 RepID=UPI0033DB2F72